MSPKSIKRLKVKHAAPVNRTMKRSKTTEKWFEKMSMYIDGGYSQAQIAKEEGLTRERIRQILNAIGLHDDWKDVQNSKKNKCKVCGKLLNKTIHYCKEHSPIVKYEEEHKCEECGEPTEPGLRSLGLCRKCYNKVGRKDYERPKRKCKLCQNDEFICSEDLCIKCYNRLKSRVKARTPIDQWRRIYNLEFEKNFMIQKGGEEAAQERIGMG